MSAAPPDIEPRLTRFREACKQAGVKMTHQRLEIFREVVSRDDHPDATSVFTGVHGRLPTVSLDTVYRTLAMLTEIGVISVLGPRHESVRFDANPAPHHHYVCTGCGAIRDFSSDDARRALLTYACCFVWNGGSRATGSARRLLDMLERRGRRTPGTARGLLDPTADNDFDRRRWVWCSRTALATGGQDNAATGNHSEPDGRHRHSAVRTTLAGPRPDALARWNQEQEVPHGAGAVRAEEVSRSCQDEAHRSHEPLSRQASRA